MFLLAIAIFEQRPAHADQASFDCLKASEAIEQVICSDPQLIALDGALGTAFAAYRQRLPEQDRSGALAEERAWLVERSKRCGVPATRQQDVALDVRWRSAPCLDEMYRARLAALGAPAEAPPAPLPQVAAPGFIHPDCLWTIITEDPDQKAPAHIPLAACAAGNRHIPVTLGNEGSVSAQGASDGYLTWLSYRLLGRGPDGREVALVWYNSGGTGQFSELYLLQRAPSADRHDVILSGELIGGGGDRCNGGIERANLIDDHTLEVDYNVTPIDLLSEVDDDVAEQAFDNLLSCAICCVGTVRRHLDLASKEEKTVSATILQSLGDDMAAGGQRSMQACFDQLVSKATGSLPHTLSVGELTALAQTFAKTCVKK